jgi:release factor H-coupled RctB family protein
MDVPNGQFRKGCRNRERAAGTHPYVLFRLVLDRGRGGRPTENRCGHGRRDGGGRFSRSSPGKFGPVGSAILSDRIHTHLIGNDIGCGMTLFALDLPARKLRLDKASGKLRALEGPWDGPVSERLEENDLAEDQHSSGLGTIGGGNHFCEVQMISEVLDDADLAALGLDKGGLVLLVHSGSRSLGASVSAPSARITPASTRRPKRPQDYLAEHDKAVAFARLNRQIIAERAAEALRTDLRLISDAPLT